MTLPRCRSYLLAMSQSYVVATYMHLSLFRLPRQNFGHQITLQLQNRYVILLAGVGLQIYKMINLGSNVIVYILKHCVFKCLT